MTTFVANIVKGAAVVLVAILFWWWINLPVPGQNPDYYGDPQYNRPPYASEGYPSHR